MAAVTDRRYILAMNAQPNASQPSAPMADGDELFLGVDMRDARTLQAGLLNAARNIRFTDFVPQTRKGVTKPGWANKVDANTSQMINAWGTIYGGNAFKDPSSRSWGILAADGYAWRLLPYNQVVGIPLPPGVQLLGPVTFCQAFDNVYCFRGQFLAPLRMQNFNDGFEDIIEHWNSTDAWPVNTEMAYGPFQAVTSITRVGNTATVTTTAPHGYITGADITHKDASQAEYNVRANITVVDDVTYTFAVTGAPASPATGTIVASNMIQYWKAIGTLETLTSLTSSSTTATATKTAHGIVTGNSVTIGGAAQTEYNGTFIATRVDANTFTYPFAGSGTTPATGTITVRNNVNTLAGSNPDTNPNDWTRAWNILPNADNAVYINNCLLVPTAYEPSSADNYATFNGGTYKKKDYLIQTNYLDDIHFDFADEFRINQGSADAIVDVAKFNENTAVVWKDASWAVLSNIALDLSQLTLDFRSYEYGLAARGAWAMAGSDLDFVATKRGMVSIRQSDNGKLMGVDLPVSAPIQKLIDRIDWTLSDGIRMANWDSKLYLAVPLDNGVRMGVDLVKNAVPAPGFGGANVGVFAIPGFVVGQQYSYTAGNSKFLYSRSPTDQSSGSGTVINPPTTFTAEKTTYWLHCSPITVTTPTATISQPRASRGNNCLLVYDLVAAARGAGPFQNLFNSFGWTPQDTGSALCPLEFFKLPVDKLERLFFLGADGYVNLMEESDDGDEVGAPGTATGLAREQIETYALTRAYLKTDTKLSKPTTGTLVLQTLNPKYSANLIFSGVNKKTVLATDATRSQTKYFRPWDAEAYDPTNTNDDQTTRDREDYAVFVPDAGLNVGSGVALDLFQEAIHNLRLNGRQGRSFQVELTNTEGRIKLLAVGLDAMPGRERKGKLS